MQAWSEVKARAWWWIKDKVEGNRVVGMEQSDSG